ncbi:MAG: hypothetical protein CR954_00940 [Candidatus Moraniibacteriota bacterium]|nr:MAG: hypothetical protein CR954_00940 [Candidatus Moranbacteria bacterium]
MGAITTICTDKTGTLTVGEMRVSHILTGTNELLDFAQKNALLQTKNTDIAGHAKALHIAAIVNDAYAEGARHDLHEEGNVHGRPTDRALLIAARHVGIDVDAFRMRYPEIDKELFTSEKKYAIRVHEMEGDKVKIMILGAPEVILQKMRFVDANNVKMPFSKRDEKQLTKTLEELTKRGLRVIACGERVLTRDTYDRLSKNKRYTDMSLVGYIALKDPLRHDVESSLAKAENAGIRLTLITGDHASTARSIMLELGHNVPASKISVGDAISEMSDDELQERVTDTQIFARVLPEHKIRIVRALQKNGEVVAMVGDGINDAPAIKASDVGISVGNGKRLNKGA